MIGVEDAPAMDCSWRSHVFVKYNYKYPRSGRPHLDRLNQVHHFVSEKRYLGEGKQGMLVTLTLNRTPFSYSLLEPFSDGSRRLVNVNK